MGGVAKDVTKAAAGLQKTALAVTEGVVKGTAAVSAIASATKGDFEQASETLKITEKDIATPELLAEIDANTEKAISNIETLEGESEAFKATGTLVNEMFDVINSIAKPAPAPKVQVDPNTGRVVQQDQFNIFDFFSDAGTAIADSFDSLLTKTTAVGKGVGSDIASDPTLTEGGVLGSAIGTTFDILGAGTEAVRQTPYVVEDAAAIAGGVIETTGDIAEGVIDVTGDVLSFGVDAIGNVAEEIVDVTTNVVGSGFDAIGLKPLGDLTRGAGDILEGGIDIVADTTSNVIEYGADAIGTTISGVADVTSSVVAGAGDIFEDVVNVDNVLRGEYFEEIGEAVAGTFVGVATDVGDYVGDIATIGVEYVDETLSELASTVSGASTGLDEMLYDIATTSSDVVYGINESIEDIEDTINETIGSVKDEAGAVELQATVDEFAGVTPTYGLTAEERVTLDTIDTTGVDAFKDFTVEADPHRYDNILLDAFQKPAPIEEVSKVVVAKAFELEVYDPLAGSDLEFAKGVKKARKTDALGKEQLLQDFTKKNTFSVGDFGTGAGIAF